MQFSKPSTLIYEAPPLGGSQPYIFGTDGDTPGGEAFLDPGFSDSRLKLSLLISQTVRLEFGETELGNGALGASGHQAIAIALRI